MKRLVVDLESNGLYDTVTKIHCIVARDLDCKSVCFYYDKHIVRTEYDGGVRIGGIKEGIFYLNRADLIIGHNFIDYDMRVIEKLYGIKLDINKIVDTMLLSHMLHPHLKRHPDCPASKETITGRKQIGAHSLENWGYYLGEGKIEYEDWSKLTPEMLERCKGDVSITEKLYKHFKNENKENSNSF